MFTLTGHSDQINALAVSEDGQIAATASGDGSLRVWNLQEVTEAWRSSEPEEILTALAMSQDGRTIFTKGMKEGLRVWTSSDNGFEARRLPFESDDFASLPIPGGGCGLVYLDEKGELIVWDGRRSAVLSGSFPRPARPLVRIRDKPWLLTGSPDQCLLLWDLESFGLVRSLQGQNAAVTALATSEGAARIIAAFGERLVRVWDLRSGEQPIASYRGRDDCTAVALSPDGQKALLGFSDGRIAIWDLAPEHEPQAVGAHTGSVDSIEWLNNRQQAISASGDGTLKVWNLERLPADERPRFHGAVTTLSLHGKKVLSACSDGLVTFWSLGRWPAHRSVQGHTDGVNAIVPISRRLAATASQDGTVKVWDTARAELHCVLTGHTDRVLDAVPIPKRRRLISCSHDQTLRIWDLRNGREISTLTGHTDGVERIALYKGGRRALSASHDGTLKIWDLDQGCELQTLRGHQDLIRNVIVRADGRLAASASETVMVWNLESGSALFTLESDPLGWYTDYRHCLAFAGERECFLLSISTRYVHVWSLQDGQRVRTLEGHEEEVTSIAVSPGGGRVLSTSSDHTAVLWDLATGSILARFHGDSELVHGIFAGDEHSILLGDLLGSVHALRLVGA